MARIKFKRRDSKLKKFKRKKKHAWRAPKGRDNKMREKRNGVSKVVSIGYGKDKKVRGTVKGKQQFRIENVLDLIKIEKGKIAMLGKVGKKKKIKIAKAAKSGNLEFGNFNYNKFLMTIEKEEKNKSKKKENSEDKKKENKTSNKNSGEKK